MVVEGSTITSIPLNQNPHIATYRCTVILSIVQATSEVCSQNSEQMLWLIICKSPNVMVKWTVDRFPTRKFPGSNPKL